MKKALRLLPLLPLLVSGACNVPPSNTSFSNNTSSSDSDVSTSEISSSSNSESSSSDISSSSASSSSSINTAVEQSKWGKEAAQKCFDTLGVVFPYLEAEGFEYRGAEEKYQA